MWTAYELTVAPTGHGSTISISPSEERPASDITSLRDAAVPFARSDMYKWHLLYESERVLLFGYYGESWARLNLYVQT